MSVIETSGSIRPGTTNTPLDQRIRVNNFAEIGSIELPYLGQIVYCLETKKYYQITGLKSKLIGAFTVQDAAVDTYEAIPVTAAEIENVVLKTVPGGQQGAVFTPSVDSDGNLSWTNNGELENPATVNIKGEKGDVFTPSVDSDGNLSWTNNGELENPATVNIKGEKGDVFTPSVDSDGNLSWTNNGELENPATVNIKGERGERGAAFKIDAIGLLNERAQYDSESKDFSFLATDYGKVYIKQSDNSGDWSDAIPFKGDKGDKGDVGITLRGEWVEDKGYVPGDAVTYQGSLYIAYEMTHGRPNEYQSGWQLYVQKGRTPEKWVDYWTEEDMLVFKYYIDEAILNGEW